MDSRGMNKDKNNNRTQQPTLKATQRPQKNKSEFTQEQLASSPWAQLGMFCNNSYRNFIPRNKYNQTQQQPIADIHKKCVGVLLSKIQEDDWETILNQYFDQKEEETAEKFFYHVSRRYEETPQQLTQGLALNLNKFAQLAQYALLKNNNPDLNKLNQFGDVIDYFNKSSSRTFLFLWQLPNILAESDRQILMSSYGYKNILQWGGSEFLSDFGLKLQKNFGITRTALKDKAAQNLVLELGETEQNLRTKIKILEQEKEELQQKIDTISEQSFQEGVYQLAKTLQEQPQPVLDQIFLLHQQLEKLSQSDEELSLSHQNSLKVLIALEDLLKGFATLNLTSFPEKPNKIFPLRGDQLGEYTYVNGSAFADTQDTKKVRCIRPGWRIGELIVTPARVEEIQK